MGLTETVFGPKHLCVSIRRSQLTPQERIRGRRRQAHRTISLRTVTQPATTLGCLTSSPGVTSLYIRARESQRVSMLPRVECMEQAHHDALAFVLFHFDKEQT